MQSCKLFGTSRLAGGFLSIKKKLLSLVRSVARGFEPVGLVRVWWASGEGLVGN